jgi:hypothetical protein
LAAGFFFRILSRTRKLKKDFKLEIILARDRDERPALL